MKARLRWAGREIRVERSGQGSASLGRVDALALLCRLATDPDNRAALRRLVAEARSTASIHDISDIDVLDRIAAWVVSGSFQIVHVAALPAPEIPPSAIVGSAAARSETRPPPASPPAARPAPAAKAATPVVVDPAIAPEQKTWIEIVLIGEDDAPIGGVRYSIELPGGETLEGTLREDGRARVDGIDPGECTVSFPDLDKHAWTSVA